MHVVPRCWKIIPATEIPNTTLGELRYRAPEENVSSGHHLSTLFSLKREAVVWSLLFESWLFEIYQIKTLIFKIPASGPRSACAFPRSCGQEAPAPSFLQAAKELIESWLMRIFHSNKLVLFICFVGLLFNRVVEKSYMVCMYVWICVWNLHDLYTCESLSSVSKLCTY